MEENTGHDDTPVDDISFSENDEGSSSKVANDNTKAAKDNETVEDEESSMDITGKANVIKVVYLQ